MKIYNHGYFSLLLCTLLTTPAAHAATADDVECIRCVDTTDINYDAVTSSRIKAGEVRTSDLAPNAVTTSRIINGAVTESKLSQDLLDIISQLQAKVAALEAENASQQATLDAQEEILDYFSLETLHDPSTGNDYPTVRVTGANLQVVNGLNATGTVNGTGNLIVGYNKDPSSRYVCSNGEFDISTCTAGGAIWSNHHRSGSHNIVTGESNNYSQYAGLVAGSDNTINRGYASVSGGTYNIASGWASSVTGGYNNNASGSQSHVSGGNGNISSGGYSSIAGGYSNSASGSLSTISGGYDNIASGAYSSVSGGYGNTASGNIASVSGGQNRSAGGTYDWAAGSLSEDF